jgi:hypothetical protein
MRQLKTMQGIRRDTQENHGNSCNFVGTVEVVNHGIACVYGHKNKKPGPHRGGRAQPGRTTLARDSQKTKLKQERLQARLSHLPRSQA